MIEKSTYQFLTNLAQNNHKEWFETNKPLFLQAQSNVIDFAGQVLEKMNQFDVIETPTGKKAVKRIYRDVRFSKDKTPYKQHFGLIYSRATAARRGSFYIHLQPGKTFIGGGFWGPEKEDLLRIRKHLAQDDSAFRTLITSTPFTTYFGHLQGDQLKTAPKGFDKEHPAIDLLRYKQFLISKSFTDAEVLAPNFVDAATETLRAMLPFFDEMTEMLTTNLNGESLIDL